MYLRLVNLSPRLFNLSVYFFLLLVFPQCISPDEKQMPVEDSVQELMEDIKSLPKVEDEDPLIEEPDYGVLFGANLSLDRLEEIGDFTADGKLTDGSLELLGELMSAIDPDIRSLLENVDPDYLMDLMDPENGLDAETQELLQKMLEMADLHIPTIKDEEELIDLEVLKERIQGIKRGPGTESFRTSGLNSDCASEVYAQFGSGARDCSFREQEEFEKIDVNYNLRMDDAEQRFLQRNVQIKTLYNNRLAIKSSLLAKIGHAIQSIDDPIAQEKVIMQVKYLGLLYATYIRMHLNTIYEKGLSINHLFFQREVGLITDQRRKMEEEIRMNLRKCLDQVNVAIIDETEARCPGEDPITY